jgi:Tfp pilus assembly protein PilF
VWGRSYERPLENVLALEDEVADAIAHELGGALAPRASTPPAPGGSPAARAPSAAVVQAYLRGRDQYQRWTPDAERRAVEFFDRALSLDPTFAPALAARGTALLMVSRAPDTVALARAGIDRALALDPALGEAHAARAKFLFELDWNWAEAEREFRRAIELNPNDSDAHHHYSHLLLALGRPDESRREAEIMRTLDPLAPASWNHMGWLEYELGNFDRAVAAERKALDLDPNYSESRQQIADVELARRRMPALRTVLDETARSGVPVDPSMLRLVDAAEHGRKDEARTLLAHMVSPADPFTISWTSVAAWHDMLGQRDDAFASLDSGFIYRDYPLMFSNFDPAVASLRTDARYGALRRRMRLPE